MRRSVKHWKNACIFTVVCYQMNTQYINIHTHYKPKIEGEYVIRNAFHLLSNEQINDLNYRVSVGLHPWHLHLMSLEEHKNYLDKTANNPNVVAIGETGFDKFAEATNKVQQAYFELHYTFARQLKKPLIIHSVKRYQELIPFIKKGEVDFILHGFNGSTELANSLNHPNCYFSFGKSLFTPQGIELFNQISLDKLFLETDNHTHLHIADMYIKASEIKGIQLEELQLKLKDNYLKVFPFDKLFTY